MPALGEISDKEFATEWCIKDFITLTNKVDTFQYSPTFAFANESWSLGIYPNGTKGDESERHINLYLYRDSSGPPITVECTLGMKATHGKLDLQRHFTYVFDEVTDYGACNLLSRSEFLKRKSVFLPSGTLTLVCKMRHPEFREFSNDGALCEDFKKMLLDDQTHDLTLKVGDKELRAHQNVLKARCRVFESMLNHDMAEKKSGVIDIPDCDPQAMEQFLLYVYCGKIENLDQTNMLGLYYIADKYDMQGLKQHCCDFIKKSLSHTNICQVVQLALTHSDTSLQECATEYFVDNTVAIMITVEWQNFLKENSTLGNELMLKSFRRKEQ